MSFLLCIYSICCNKLIIKLYYPHSKCGERVTAPWVRIPVFPLDNYDLSTQNTKMKHIDIAIMFYEICDFPHIVS